MPHIAVACGLIATFMYVAASLPMLAKAARTKDLRSYSGANLMIANTGNVTQSVYVLALPPGPLWLLHGFNTAVSALMLWWWVQTRRSTRWPSSRKPPRPAGDSGKQRLVIADYGGGRF